MIIPTWSQFRAAFAVPLAPIANDGLPEWPAANVDQPGFVNSITFEDPISFPWFIEVDPGPDAVSGVDQFDWWLSQRSDVVSHQYWQLQRNDDLPVVTNSGRIKLVPTALAISLYPDGFDIAAQLVLFKNLDLYALRKADGLIQHRLLEDVVFMP